MPQIIQFLHPGPEAILPRGLNILPWNCGNIHKRKFLLSKGKYVSNNSEEDACLTFWGEWEPQSYVERLPNLGQHYPSYLNRPFLDVTVPDRCHNTDPYVFGVSFKYFICQQGVKKILRNLDPLSLILFGSCIEGKFCLDTLFVVSDRQVKYKKTKVNKLGKKNTVFYPASIEPLLNEKYCEKIKCNSVEDEYTYYEGITFNDRKQFKNIFSFAPSMIYKNQNDTNFAFQRPAIEIPEIISPRQTQSINGNGGRNYSVEEIVNVWHKIVDTINKKNLVLGTHFEEPVKTSIKKVISDKNIFKC